MVIFGAQRMSMALLARVCVCVRGVVMCNTVSACGCRRTRKRSVGRTLKRVDRVLKAIWLRGSSSIYRLHAVYINY